MYCKNCKFWITTKEYHTIINPEDPDTFEIMKNLPFEVRYCKSPKITFYERPIEDNGATVIDGSQYKAALITAPKFGCVQFQKK